MKATYITVNNVRELKAIASNPDVLFKNGIVKSQEPLIRDLSDRNIRAKKDVSGYDNVMLACSTMAAYIYGDSEAVKESEEILDAIFFPMKIACFGSENQDVVVHKNSPLVLKASSAIPIYATFRNITLQEGAKIKIYGNASMDIAKIVQAGKYAGDGSISLHGANGGNGGTGATLTFYTASDASSIKPLTAAMENGPAGAGGSGCTGGSGGLGGISGATKSDGQSGKPGVSGKSGNGGNHGNAGKCGDVSVVKLNYRLPNA